MIETTLPTQEDYRRYDDVWKRVSPSLEPYPAVRAAQTAAPTMRDSAGKSACLGDAAQGETAVIEAFLQDALANAQTYRYLASHAPTAAGGRVLRKLAADETAQVKTLQSVYFLMTGGTYGVTVVLPPQPRLPWRDRLRERWQAESSAGLRYAAAASKTADVCLKRLYTDLSEEAYRHAERLRRLLAETL